MVEHLFGTQLSNRDFFIRRWQMEYPAFVDVFKALPGDRLDYRPHPASRSAGELVALLVSLEHSCAELCETGRGSYNINLRFHSIPDSSALTPMIAAYEEHHCGLREKLEGLDENTWNRSAWLTRGDQEIILRDSVGGLLWTALFDGVHHRGQLSTYIRPMGGKVPSIYGPSGDAPARDQQD
jgi:DinB family